MEEDFNFGNKVYVGSRMIWNAISHKQILPELYGGIKGRRADHMALTRVQLANTMLQKRCPGAIASVDAQSCYDRIAHIPAALCCQRWGVPPQIMHTMLLTIQLMKFYLRTAFGDSTTFYGGGLQRFQGICQGNGAGPAIWLAISTCLLLGMYNQGCRPTILRSTFSTTTLHLMALLFVDDTDLPVIAQSPSTHPRVVIQNLQKAVTTWQHLLTASGGSLSAEKCSWTIAAFAWSKGKWSLRTTKSIPGDITIDSTTEGAPQPIQRVNPSEAIKVVGSIQALDGNMRGQLAALKAICAQWANILSHHSMPRNFAWSLFRSKIWPRLRYPLLACTTISRNQGKQLMSGLYRILLPRMGSNRNLPCTIRHGPPNLLGLNLPDPYIHQGAQQVASFLHLFGTTTNEGHLLQISLEQLQLEVGIQAPILSTDLSTYGFLATPCWLTSLWEFISRYNNTLQVECKTHPLQRTGDKHLMDLVFTHNQWDKPQLRYINQWRLNQRILLLSDCITGDGRRIRLETIKGKPCSTQPITEWPQEHPPRHSFTLWINALQALFAQPEVLPLGEWSQPLPSPTQWTWWYSPTEHTLFQLQAGRWTQYTAVSTRPTRQHATVGVPFRPHAIIRPPTHRPLLHRATVYHTVSSRVLYEGSSPSTSLPDPVEAPTPLSVLDSWEPDLTWPLHHSRFPTNSDPIAAAIRNGTAHGACDGSFMPQLSTKFAAAAWILEDAGTPGQDICQGATLVSGQEGEVNAYRAELQGIHAVLCALLLITEVHHISSGAITIYCDNERAVDLASKVSATVRESLSHHDLHRAISHLIGMLPITATFIHVKGHQARTSEAAHLLPRPVQMNIRCDELAKKYLQQSLALPIELRKNRQRLKGELTRCFLHGIKVITNPCSVVTEHCTTSMLKTYVLQRGTLTVAAWDLINWPAIGRALRARSEQYRLCASKFSYDKPPRAQTWCAGDFGLRLPAHAAGLPTKPLGTPSFV